MRQRIPVCVTATLASLGLALTASAAPPSHAERHAPARVSVQGIVTDWDTGSSLTIADPDVRGGSRAARRVLRGLDELELGVGPGTRVVAEDEDGARERIDADELFSVLEDGAEDLEIDATALVERRSGRRPGVPPTITAKRIVLYLAAPGESLDDGADPSEVPAPGDDDPGPGPGPRAPSGPGSR